MRKIFTLLFMATCLFANAQTTSNANTAKTISVSGAASLEIVPDEIYLQVDLKEYEKKGKELVDIDNIKSSFLQACKDAGIPDSAISIYNYGGNNLQFYLKRKKDKEELKASISYWIKFNNPSKIEALVSKLDDDATKNFSIVSMSHSKIIEYRKQLKIQAIKAAKEKAIYLADAIGEKVGPAIKITEPDDANTSYKDNNYAYSNGRMVYAHSQSITNIYSDNSGSSIDFKKIKLRFEIDVVFALQ